MVVWDYALETGCVAIDAEHREIVQLMGVVHEAVEQGNAAQTATALDRLTLRLAEHFEHEERLMAACDYAQTLLHKEAHATFLADVAKGRKALAMFGLSDTFRQWAFGRLVTWFRFHIKALDMGLGQEIRRHEVSQEGAVAQL